jgi:hypothetical protein
MVLGVSKLLPWCSKVIHVFWSEEWSHRVLFISHWNGKTPFLWLKTEPSFILELITNFMQRLLKEILWGQNSSRFPRCIVLYTHINFLSLDTHPFFFPLTSKDNQRLCLFFNTV